MDTKSALRSDKGPTNGHQTNGVRYQPRAQLSMWALMLYALPAVYLLADVSCTQGNCSIYEFPPFPAHLSAYVNGEALFMYFGWMVLQALLFVMPTGSKRQRTSPDGSTTTYRLNGIHGCCVTTVLLILAINLGYTDYLSKIIDNFLALHVISLLTSVTIAVYLYRSTQRKSGTFLTGSESNPSVLGWDFKRFLLRTALMTWVVVGFGHQVMAYSKFHKPSALMTITIIHMFAVAETLFFEESWENSLLFQHDRVGAAFVYGCLTAVPVLFTLSIRYLSSIDYQFGEAPLIIRFLVAVPGYCLYRGANTDKVSFEKDPDSPDYDEFYVIREENGRSILADSYWGHCRNPTYLGAIILVFSTTAFGDWDSMYLNVCFLTFAVLMVIRSVSMDRINSDIYGNRLWTAYRQKVKNRLIKFIF